MKVISHTPAQMLRILKIRGGIIAVLGRSIWIATKAIINTDITVNNAIMRALFHWRLLIYGMVKAKDENLQHTLSLPTEAPRLSISRQVLGIECQEDLVPTASPSMGF
jgi:hypothetical protein